LKGTGLNYLRTICNNKEILLHFLIIKPTRCTNFSNLFWNEILHVSDSSSVHPQEFFTVHTAIVYVIQVCWQLSCRIRMELQFHPEPVQWKTPDDGQRKCPKHVQFHSKNKSEKSVHLVGFTIIKFIMMHGHMNVKKFATFSKGKGKGKGHSVTRHDCHRTRSWSTALLTLNP